MYLNEYEKFVHAARDLAITRSLPDNALRESDESLSEEVLREPNAGETMARPSDDCATLRTSASPTHRTRCCTSMLDPSLLEEQGGSCLLQ